MDPWKTTHFCMIFTGPDRRGTSMIGRKQVFWATLGPPATGSMRRRTAAKPHLAVNAVPARRSLRGEVRQGWAQSGYVVRYLRSTTRLLCTTNLLSPRLAFLRCLGHYLDAYSSSLSISSLYLRIDNLSFDVPDLPPPLYTASPPPHTMNVRTMTSRDNP